MSPATRWPRRPSPPSPLGSARNSDPGDQVMRNTTAITLALAAAVLLASCSKSPDEGARRTNRVIEAPRSGATGGVATVAPDAPRHTVLVVAPPSAPLLVAKQQAKMEAAREAT